MKAPYLFVYSTIHIRKVDYVLLLFHAFTGVYMSEEESQWFFFFLGGGFDNNAKINSNNGTF